MIRALLTLFILGIALPAAAAEVRLSAATSLAEAMKELTFAYAASNRGVIFRPNFGGSGALAKQIVQGAPADIFISANPKWMEYLVEEGAVPKETVRVLAGNTLVFVGPKGAKISALKDLLRLGRIALGSPRSVPAGEYAKQALEKAGVWGALASGGKLVMTEDVRQALLYADRGEVDGAVVYRTDALLAREAKILLDVPHHLHDPVTYPIALTLQGAKNPAAVGFYHHLKTPEATKILRKYGFRVR